MIIDAVTNNEEKANCILVISLQSMSEWTINHVLCYSGHRTPRTIKDNTIESHNIWVVQVSKLACFIPKVISLIEQKTSIQNKGHLKKIFEQRKGGNHDNDKRGCQHSWNAPTMRSCSEGFPAKHLSVIRFIATSVPLHFPWYTVPNVPDPSSRNSSRSLFLIICQESAG